jgi:hypothetical protein
VIFSLYESRHGIRIFLAGKVTGWESKWVFRGGEVAAIKRRGCVLALRLVGFEDADLAAGKVLQL